MPNHQQRTVLISGATSGIGFATARYLQAQGWRVIGAGLAQDDFGALQAGDAPIHTIALDITDETSIAEAKESIESLVGSAGLDALVNNAGIHITGALESMPMAQIRRQFDVNVFGHLALTQAMIPLLRPVQGRIVFVSSLMGRVAMPILGAYSMSKHALEAMADVLRIELRAWGIDVSVIEPGAIDTPMTHHMGDALNKNRQVSHAERDALYDGLYQSVADALATQSKGATPVDKVARVIEKALTDQPARARYSTDSAGAGLMLMRRLAPHTIADTILMRALGIHWHKRK